MWLIKAMFLVSHAILLRGDNVRRIDLADFWVFVINKAIDLVDPSSTECIPCMILNLMGTKNNAAVTTTSRDFGVALRHRNAETCVIGSLAVYLFMRFNVSTWPDFSISSNWYQTKLFPSRKNSETEISYQDHNTSIKELLLGASIVTTKVTHISRKGGLSLLGT